ncbi:hypothetical protein SELMODRAFT_403760 [Selaginella moellendorffii]|uniref:Uncharacterized protein n=1 Tax=Selaginella moellendorffii TaxID=88036 RepID=D8QSF8_SELML|nr:hypothetical protein SELMODRAFT_403760 [Selaginella moellendorffii]
MLDSTPCSRKQRVNVLAFTQCLPEDISEGFAARYEVADILPLAYPARETQPELSMAHIDWAQTSVLTTVIDDFMDTHHTLNNLGNFCTVSDKNILWPAKINVLGLETPKIMEWPRCVFLRGRMASLEEYMENEIMSFTLDLICLLFLVEKVESLVLEDPEYTSRGAWRREVPDRNALLARLFRSDPVFALVGCSDWAFSARIALQEWSRHSLEDLHGTCELSGLDVSTHGRIPRSTRAFSLDNPWLLHHSRGMPRHLAHGIKVGSRTEVKTVISYKSGELEGSMSANIFSLLGLDWTYVILPIAAGLWCSQHGQKLFQDVLKENIYSLAETPRDDSPQSLIEDVGPVRAQGTRKKQRTTSSGTISMTATAVAPKTQVKTTLLPYQMTALDVAVGSKAHQEDIAD